ncbi:MAG: hypothetical protein HY260_16005 [Chloroflexi bacterium]|nr:hypothetical protein [Chloroflexota bacterium]
MARIVEWQSLRMQEYRHQILVGVARFFELFGVRRPMSLELAPASAGDYDDSIHREDHPADHSLIAQYLQNQPRAEPKAGGQPRETAAPDSGSG